MSETLVDIRTKVDKILKEESKTITRLSEQEMIDEFLDSISSLKRTLRKSTKALRSADEFLSSITWLDDSETKNDKELAEIIDGGLAGHRILIMNYVKMRRTLWQDNVAKKELADFKDAIDDFEETLFELNQIFFELRKDEEFNELVDKVA